MASDLPGAVLAFCHKHGLITPQDKIVVGVSGGPDSLCLLHVLTTLRQEFNLSLVVAHLNHQLRGADSQADANFVQELATRWQIPHYSESRDITALASARKQSIEETARQVRYAFLWQIANTTEANKIAVGHNADDQVETVLMHFLRGTGLGGLRGMLPETSLAALRLQAEDRPMAEATPNLIRPLLGVSRAEIEAYCRENNLEPRQDYTNQDTTYFRNRLRHELIPYLETYNPNIRQVLQNTASVVAADTQVLEDQLNRVWKTVAQNETYEKIVFDLQAWLKLPLGFKRSTLRRTIYQLRHQLRDISFINVEKAIEVINKGQTGAQVTLPQGLILTVSYNTFIINTIEKPASLTDFNDPQLFETQRLHVNIPGQTALPSTGWRLEARLLSRQNLELQDIAQTDKWEAYLDADIVGNKAILRTRHPGDTFYPFGMEGHSKKVNEFMINEKIPAGRRRHIPLLVANGQILWVCGYRLDERARVRVDTENIVHLRFKI